MIGREHSRRVALSTGGVSLSCGASTRSRIAVAAAALAVTQSLLSIPAATAAPAPPKLAREVTLVGNGTGWVPVRLTAPLRFGADGPVVVRLNNAAAFAGVLLVREQAGVWPPGTGVVSLPRDGGVPYAGVFFGHERGTNAEDDLPTIFRKTLLPGRYRLYLLARGTTTVKVTVRFPVAAGRQTFPVRRNTTHDDSIALAPGVAGTAVTPTQTHSAKFPLRRRGLLLSVLWWQSDARAYFKAGSCAYSGAVPDPAPVPSCPNGPGASASGVEVQSPDRSVNLAYSYVDPGTWLQKSYYAVAGPVRRGGIANYWLDLGAGYPAG